jgi:GNAT superfamily N-acetyltransferase
MTACNTDQVRIRDARVEERAALETLQRRSSDVWEEYREQFAAHPDAIELPAVFLENGWVRVAADDAEVAIGFSVVIPGADGIDELDGLFVAPERMRAGVGRELVRHACARSRAAGAHALQVIAGPAQGFYEKLGFVVVEAAPTRFGPAVRMRLAL